MTSTRQRRNLSAVYNTNYTVLCGRGLECFDHVGNRRLRVTVLLYMQRYEQAQTKSRKGHIISDIIETFRSAGGGFVRQKKDGSWYEVSDRVSREKVGSLFRDCLYEKYRSSARAKNERRHAARMQTMLARRKKVSFVTEEEETHATCTLSDSDTSVVSDDLDFASISESFDPLEDEDFLSLTL